MQYIHTVPSALSGSRPSVYSSDAIPSGSIDTQVVEVSNYNLSLDFVPPDGNALDSKFLVPESQYTRIQQEQLRSGFGGGGFSLGKGFGRQVSGSVQTSLLLNAPTRLVCD
ncbi:hypothetical protein AAMO2058_000967200 [Amorphochlora amoebiformis]